MRLFTDRALEIGPVGGACGTVLPKYIALVAEFAVRTLVCVAVRLILRSLNGEMPEWLNGTVSKTVVRATVPRVRIPLSPQEHQ